MSRHAAPRRASTPPPSALPADLPAALTAAGPAPADTSAARAAAAQAITGDGGSVAATGRRRLRRALPGLLLAFVIAAVVVLGLLTRTDADTTPLSPGNGTPTGARAVAQVLEDEGVEVVHARTLADAEAARARLGGATLFFSDPNGWLNEEQLSSLNRSFPSRVLAAPSEPQLLVLAPEILPAGPAEDARGTVRAGCTREEARAAGEITGGGQLYSAPVECFNSPAADGGTGASYAAVGGTVVLGNPGILTNGTIEEAGNASLALSTLGAAESLIWYQPTTADLAGATGPPANPLQLLPDWVNTLMLWLLGCALLAMLWRGRRLGPLAVEPLPVLVSAAETAEGRARLYQGSRAVRHAAANLRAATLSRAAARLRLPPSSARAAVVQAVAQKTGRRPEDVHSLLDGPPPSTEKDLARWAQQLLDLEKEINNS
ncbi:DUF4350 domain-containing protein [Arthrobacter crusticola]|uniref:DUF4350 domain-containing protein n=1 Tax=Arthrobacter crusticola TaxID=2547960 RepID=A0A4R5TMH5_9MICC|nr:DUF4350 domain-containing protein [Arthrobacter crusticola]TDK23579.1 DUF4350 domain-containing protein [Arthrobacter crusticola]